MNKVIAVEYTDWRKELLYNADFKDWVLRSKEINVSDRVLNEITYMKIWEVMNLIDRILNDDIWV
jgi:hypothetical protein